MEETLMIKKAMKAAGYEGEYTKENLIECYVDYATAYGKDIEEVREDIATGELTVPMMCRALIRSN